MVILAGEIINQRILWPFAKKHVQILQSEFENQRAKNKRTRKKLQQLQLQHKTINHKTTIYKE